MKLLAIVLALSCAIVYASADSLEKSPTGPGLPPIRLEEPKRNSISFQGSQPLSGPMRQPSWDLNANRNIFDNGRTRTDIYGGMSKVPGQRVQPHVGIQTERNFGNNGFIRGHGQLQPGRGGHVSPSVGITGGFRFRREAEPQRNSFSFQGSQPLSGPMRQPSWDLNANRNIFDNGRTRTDIYGGMSKVPGQRVQPHVGIQTERNFGNNGFIRGNGQLQPGRGGHGVSPSVGVTGGFRFRREAEPQRNSFSFQGSQPLSGPVRQPSWDLNASRNIFDNGRTRADIYGGMSKVPGQRVQSYGGLQANSNIYNKGNSRADVYGGLDKVPGQRVQSHVGIQAERNFGKNGFIRGNGQIQPGPGGHGVSPSVGVTGGFRFRREAEDTVEVASIEEY